MKQCFDTQRAGTGTREWADTNFNITDGCRNNCLYCYAAEMATSRFKRRSREDWKNESLTSNAFVSQFPKKDGVVMFPSTHDITPFNVHDYSRVAAMMLSAGNSLLITSKPDPSVIRKLLADLGQWKDQILFRYTIGTLDASVAKYWEPGAPTPQERMVALVESLTTGFRTSISIEPLLGGVEDAMRIVHVVQPFVTDTIWIGKLDQGKRRVAEEHRIAVEGIEFQQRDEEILRLVKMLNGNSKIRWKDSIKHVIKKYSAG